MLENKKTLIVESNKPGAIQMAFNMAEASFKNVSPVTPSDNAGTQSFVIAPSGSCTQEEALFNVEQQQEFVAWCEQQNAKAKKQVLKIKHHSLWLF